MPPIPRLPQHDSLPESPVDWEDIPRGAGQDPSPFNAFQFTKEGDPYLNTDVRRNPDHTWWIIGRNPERPY